MPKLCRPHVQRLGSAYGKLKSSNFTPWQDEWLTYGELDRRANQLAHRLIALGVGPEVPVGVMIPRSLHVMVALLGVLKAGGAYVPMDPSYPPDRLVIMLEDSEARVAHLAESGQVFERALLW